MAENEAASGIKVLYIAYREHIKTHFCQILKGLIFDMKHLKVVLYSVVKMASSQSL